MLAERPDGPQSKEIYFSLDPDEFDEDTLDLLSESERKRVIASPTFKETKEIIELRKKSPAEIIGESELPWDDDISVVNG